MSVDKEKQFTRQNDFIKNKYDRFTLFFSKGMKEKYKAVADGKGMSLNSYINKLLEDSIKNPPAE